MGRQVVIGGGSGIGEQFALEMQEAGEKKWEVPSKAKFNVSGLRDITNFFPEGGEPVDELVFCAGVNYLERLGSMDSAKVMTVYSSNVIGFILLMDHLAKTQPQHPISIVAIGSDAAVRPMRTSIAYCSSKAALHMAVRVTAREKAADGWRVNVVAPGMTDDTEMTKYVDKTVMDVRGWSREKMLDYEAQQEVTPGRIQKYEVSEVILSTLRGPAHLNGSIIFINGGR